MFLLLLKELVRNMTFSSAKQILMMQRKGNAPIFPSIARDRKYYFLLEAKTEQYINNNNKVNATVAVKWNAGIGLNKNSIQIYTEFLEMFHRYE